MPGKKTFSEYSNKILLAAGIFITIILIFYFFYSIPFVLLLVFAGILLAVLLDGLAGLLNRYIKIPRGAAITIIVLVLLLFLIGAGFLIGPPLGEQMVKLAERVPDAVNQVESYLSQYEWGKTIISEIPKAQEMVGSGQKALSFLTGAFSSILGLIGNILLIAFIGIYFSVEPKLYIDNSIRLLPKEKRERAHEIFRKLGHALRFWLIGQFASMAVVGILTSIGLWIIGMPLTLSLGFIAAIFSFVPYIGPIAAFVIVFLAAFAEGPMMVVYSGIVYIVVQQVESYIITPLIQQHVTSLPPVILIITQVLMGVLFGIFGIILATPLAVVVIVLVQTIYVEDILQDPVNVLG